METREKYKKNQFHFLSLDSPKDILRIFILYYRLYYIAHLQAERKESRITWILQKRNWRHDLTKVEEHWSAFRKKREKIIFNIENEDP